MYSLKWRHALMRFLPREKIFPQNDSNPLRSCSRDLICRHLQGLFLSQGRCYREGNLYLFIRILPDSGIWGWFGLDENDSPIMSQAACHMALLNSFGQAFQILKFFLAPLFAGPVIRRGGDIKPLIRVVWVGYRFQRRWIVLPQRQTPRCLTYISKKHSFYLD